MKNSNNILLIDPAFDPNTAAACNLLIKVGLDTFSYAIINHETKKVSAIFDEQECEDGALKLSERLKTDSYLKLPFRQIKVAVNTANAIAIPNDFYTEDHLSSNAQYFSSAANENVYTNLQDHFGFTTLFSLPSSVEKIFEDELKDSIKYQELAGLISLAEQIQGSALILDFSVGATNVLYVKDNKIQFQQSYEIGHSEELNYYILLMIKQLAIDPQQTKLLLSGIIHEGDEKYNCLHKYFPQIQFSIIENELNKEVLENMPLHYYSSLLALNQCV
jgi:hypothetical protein